MSSPLADPAPNATLSAPHLNLPSAEDCLPTLIGGRKYLDLSDLPSCVSVSVSVQIYSDDLIFERPKRPTDAA